MDKIFTDKDKMRMEKVLGKIENAGGLFGSFLNKGTMKIIKIIILSFSVVIFGLLIFFWKAIMNAFNRKGEL